VSAVLEMPKTGHAEVEVLDLQGRHVATVFQGEVEAGSRVLAWDGRDDDGRDPGPGVYFLRVTSGGVAATTRLVKLR
jgi:flagellar hook assembly protein FlgD